LVRAWLALARFVLIQARVLLRWEVQSASWLELVALVATAVFRAGGPHPVRGVRFLFAVVLVPVAKVDVFLSALQQVLRGVEMWASRLTPRLAELVQCAFALALLWR
jgi:hypothetical protein